LAAAGDCDIAATLGAVAPDIGGVLLALGVLTALVGAELVAAGADPAATEAGC
jgi:hypothetical protein